MSRKEAVSSGRRLPSWQTLFQCWETVTILRFYSGWDELVSCRFHRWFLLPLLSAAWQSLSFWLFKVLFKYLFLSCFVCVCIWINSCKHGYSWIPESVGYTSGAGVTVLMSYSTWLLGLPYKHWVLLIADPFLTLLDRTSLSRVVFWAYQIWSSSFVHL